jgi:hypothetical protein
MIEGFFGFRLLAIRVERKYIGSNVELRGLWYHVQCR